MSYPKEVRTAVSGAFYPRALAAADTARTRAQSGYTIASAVAAALVAAGILTDICDQQLPIQVLALLSIAAWVVTAILFMWSVAVPVELALPAVLPSADAFVDAVLGNARTERDELNKRTASTPAGRQLRRPSPARIQTGAGRARS